VSSRVFISYATQDKDIADQVLQFLESKDQSCWIAPRDIPPGSDWAESIIDGLDAARYMILILSSAVSSSPHIRRELERAVSRNITIFPMILEEFDHPKWIQYYISAHQWIDAAPVSSKLRSRLDELLRTLVKSSVVNNNALSKVSGEKSELIRGGGPTITSSGAAFGKRVRLWYKTNKKRLLKTVLMCMIIGSMINLVAPIALVYEASSVGEGSLSDILAKEYVTEMFRIAYMCSIPYVIYGVLFVVSRKVAQKTLGVSVVFTVIVFTLFEVLARSNAKTVLLDGEAWLYFLPMLISIVLGVTTVIGLVVTAVSHHVEK